MRCALLLYLNPKPSLFYHLFDFIYSHVRIGAAAVQGTGRPTMEDTYNVVIDAKGSDPSFFGVFDGHGGIAVAEYVVLALYTCKPCSCNLIK